MKYITILVFCFTFFASQAQSTWDWGITLSAGVNGDKERDFQINENQGGTSSTYLTQQIRQPSYGGGLWIGKQWGRHFETTLGIEYLQKSTFFRNENTYYAALGNMTSFHRSDYTTSAQMLQAPLKVNYIFGKANRFFRPFVGVGIVASYITRLDHSTTSLNAAPGSEEHYSAYNDRIDLSGNYYNDLRWNFPLLAQLGIRIGKHSSLSIQYTRTVRQEVNHVFASNYYYGGIACCFGDCYMPYAEPSSKVGSHTTFNFQYAF